MNCSSYHPGRVVNVLDDVHMIVSPEVQAPDDPSRWHHAKLIHQLSAADGPGCLVGRLSGLDVLVEVEQVVGVVQTLDLTQPVVIGAVVRGNL